MSALRIIRLSIIATFLMSAGCRPVLPPKVTHPEEHDGRHSALADGVCALTHCDAFQTGAIAVRGPASSSRTLSPQEIDLLWESPIAAGQFDVRYPDGTVVLWVPKVDRIEKVTLRDGRLSVLQSLRLSPRRFPYFSERDMERAVAELDRLRVGSKAYRAAAARWHGYETEALRAYYGALARDKTLYVGAVDRIIAYGDAEPGLPESPIVKKGEYVFDPAQLNKGAAVLIGFNMTYDGHLVAVSMDGTLIVVEARLTHAEYYRFADERIWNGIAVDERGGIYVATDRRLHKLVWTGRAISDRAVDGAWAEAYGIGLLDQARRGGRGTGTTPVLMGASTDRDRFVVIADAADINNIVLYWRDEIPRDWPQVLGATSRRVAGRLPVNFGNRKLEESYSENAAVVFDYGAVFTNNRPKTGEPMHLDVLLRITDPTVTPAGAQKFKWDPETRTLRSDWVRPDLSNPSSTPVISTFDRRVHFVAVRKGRWVWETVDWDSGETTAVYTLGPSQRYNPAYIALQLLPNGDPLYAGFGGLVHLRIGPESSAARP